MRMNVLTDTGKDYVTVLQASRLVGVSRRRIIEFISNRFVEARYEYQWLIEKTSLLNYVNNGTKWEEKK